MLRTSQSARVNATSEDPFVFRLIRSTSSLFDLPSPTPSLDHAALVVSHTCFPFASDLLWRKCSPLYARNDHPVL